eukprot:CAMPEP_0201883020 /NCGR_PEP_ID=MMETSP0902-20130614/15099_1 /ASSEMBLY_ACC=CAM_ASM_000551 /TAXON_ID=420261 /ORGANISM="Thalassiosira antarctica, Strain CCMP982" /LENGTH=135 /DNA_ID=CAMNT_0048411721 /DNA_START=298 /DNA_END=704 /DNA_ORIENTATION=+
MASSELGCQNKGPDHVQDARFGSSDLTVVTTWNVAAGQAFAMVAAKTDVPAKEDVYYFDEGTYESEMLYYNYEVNGEMDEYFMKNGVKNSVGGKLTSRWKGNSRTQHRQRAKANRGYHRPTKKRSHQTTIRNAFD